MDPRDHGVFKGLKGLLDQKDLKVCKDLKVPLVLVVYKDLKVERPTPLRLLFLLLIMTPFVLWWCKI